MQEKNHENPQRDRLSNDKMIKMHSAAIKPFRYTRDNEEQSAYVVFERAA